MSAALWEVVYLVIIGLVDLYILTFAKSLTLMGY